MIRALGLAAILSLGLASPSFAMCFGTGLLQNCSDSSGNSYTVYQFGSARIVQGQDSRTGTAATPGDTTFQSGATSGNPWQMTDEDFGAFGTDMQDNPCDPLGCN
jgi:hypothetical protein